MVISKNLNRIKNILDGKFTDKTKISVGYSKKEEFHKEGEIWEENGKQWTIKDGITINITKLKSARDASIIPLACPKCNKPLNTFQSKACWKINNMCVDCNISEDTLKMATGEYNKERSAKRKVEAIKYLESLKLQFADYINTHNSKAFITEAGDVEDWNSNLSNDKLKEMFETKVKEFESFIETL